MSSRLRRLIALRFHTFFSFIYRKVLRGLLRYSIARSKERTNCVVVECEFLRPCSFDRVTGDVSYINLVTACNLLLVGILSNLLID